MIYFARESEKLGWVPHRDHPDRCWMLLVGVAAERYFRVVNRCGSRGMVSILTSMITDISKLKLSVIIILAALSTLAGCAGLNDPYYGTSSPGYGAPYGGGYGGYPYGSGYGDPYAYGDRRERERLERERERLERERERLERERERQQQFGRPPAPAPRPPANFDRCPPGFSPSENKCSPAERRRGCQDIRTPSGLGCVKR